MAQLDFHNASDISSKARYKNSSSKPPTELPVIQKLVSAYKLWHEFLPHFPKTSRYTLGAKIDSLFVETVEPVLLASHQSKEKKLPLVHKALTKLDVLKFFLQIAWEIKGLDNKKYIMLSERLDEIGRMLGGWYRQLNKENPTTTGGGK